jgi:hypothetical protein
MKWVTSKRHMTAEHRLARAVQTLQADVHSSPASSRLKRFKLTHPFCRKTKSGFCACAITFSNAVYIDRFLPAVFNILVTCKVNSLNSVARGDIRSKETGANPLSDKGDIKHRSSLETFELYIDETYITLLIHFVKIC